MVTARTSAGGAIATRRDSIADRDPSVTESIAQRHQSSFGGNIHREYTDRTDSDHLDGGSSASRPFFAATDVAAIWNV